MDGLASSCMRCGAQCSCPLPAEIEGDEAVFGTNTAFGSEPLRRANALVLSVPQEQGNANATVQQQNVPASTSTGAAPSNQPPNPNAHNDILEDFPAAGKVEGYSMRRDLKQFAKDTKASQRDKGAPKADIGVVVNVLHGTQTVRYSTGSAAVSNAQPMQHQQSAGNAVLDDTSSAGYLAND